MNFVMTFDDGQALVRAAGNCVVLGKLYLPQEIGIAIKEQHCGAADGDPKFRTERLVRYVGKHYFQVNDDQDFAHVSGDICRKIRALSYEDEQAILIQMMADGAKARMFRKVERCQFRGIDVCNQVTQCHDYDGHKLRGRPDHYDGNGRKLKA